MMTTALITPSDAFRTLSSEVPGLSKTLGTLCPNQSPNVRKSAMTAYDAWHHGLLDPDMLSVILLYGPTYWDGLSPMQANASKPVCDAVSSLIETRRHAPPMQDDVISKNPLTAIPYVFIQYGELKYDRDAHSAQWLRAYYSTVLPFMDGLRTTWSEKLPKHKSALNWAMDETRALVPDDMGAKSW